MTRRRGPHTLGDVVASEQAAEPAPVPLHRNRDFLCLWSGQAVSVLGSQVSRVAYPLLVLALTGSAAKAGYAGAAASPPPRDRCGARAVPPTPTWRPKG